MRILAAAEFLLTELAYMYQDDPELDLTLQAVAGDRAALSQLLLLHYDSLQRQVSVRISHNLRGLVRAEDVMQQTFVRVAQSIESFDVRHPGAFRAWLRTIAFNLVRDFEKRRRRERLAASPTRFANKSSPDSHRVSGLPLNPAADTTGPSRAIQRKENVHRMRSAVDKLPPDQRQAIELYYFQGRSLAEVAQSMGRTKDAVRGICFRARKNLRSIVGESSLYFSG